MNQQESSLPTSTKNFLTLTRVFIRWITETYKGNVPVCLGGCNIDHKNSCLKIVNGTFSCVQGLECFYNEADDHLINNFYHVVKCDQNIFVNLMYNFSNWSN